MMLAVYVVDEAQEILGQAVTEAEVVLVEGAGAWRTCPVDGTRFFIRSQAYPGGRPAGARWCSNMCESMAQGQRDLDELTPGQVADVVAEEGAVERALPDAEAGL